MPDLTAFSELFQPLGLKEGDWCLHMENQPWNPHPHVARIQFTQAARAKIPDLLCLSGCPGAGSISVEAEAMCLHSLRMSLNADKDRLLGEIEAHHARMNVVRPLVAKLLLTW